MKPSQVSAELPIILHEVERYFAPVWPLQDYVAVNPFAGVVDQDFLSVRQRLRSVRDVELLMPANYFSRQWAEGTFDLADVQAALEECRESHGPWYADWTPQDVIDRLEPAPGVESPKDDRQMWTVAERIDRAQATCWSQTIVQEVSRHCAAYFDAGQASWPSPGKNQGLYKAWRQIAAIDRRIERLGVPAFRQFVAGLPESATDCILHMLQQLRIPTEIWKDFLLCQSMSVAGWASYCRYRAWQPGTPADLGEDFVELLAIRLAYDASLTALEAEHDWTYTAAERSPSHEALARYACQTACEVAYRRRLCTMLATSAAPAAISRSVQMVFCIDVRSEVFRRHLESVTSRVETFGFAGFFGLPIEHAAIGDVKGQAQCPVLLVPSMRSNDRLLGHSASDEKHAIERRASLRLARKLWKQLRVSAASCFSYVEAFGLYYLLDLIRKTLAISSSSDRGEFDGIPRRERKQLRPVLQPLADEARSRERDIDVAQAILRNLGLTQDFASLVVFCGHGSEVTNNPHQAGLDCGACGGHSGAPNARVVASLLNQDHVRRGLSEKGIHIPQDTVFLAALHNTTTDEITYFDTETAEREHAHLFGELRQWTRAADSLARRERGKRMGSPSDKAIQRRSRDWSEVRPEWGLAGNAAFIVAPRSRTAGHNLEGRAFLHSYDQGRDPELKTLELIMTAPMIVTNWINLQYYASTVDNRAYGCGNKALHNVVGLLGVFEGNGGDLLTGLPWQSIHDGTDYQHEPLRLLVIIEATRAAIESIVDKHALVRDLAQNGWLTIVALEGEVFHRLSARGKWVEVPLATFSSLGQLVA
jgi:uncharacterized protein YbcC (UPF0753/DUF2309 family)